MDRVLSSHVIVNHRLTTSWLGKVERAKINGVEIFCAKQHLDWRNSSQVTELGHWFRDSELRLHSLHSPMYTDERWGKSGPDTHINITEHTKGDRIKWVDEIKRAIEVAETVPFKYLIQHLGVNDQEFSERTVDAAFSSLDELGVFARQRGVEILLENIRNDLASADRLRQNNELTHLNMKKENDAGHAQNKGGDEREFEIMAPRIRSLHLHDNNGVDDMHLYPQKPGGTIDWKRTMELLRSRPGQYPFLLELREVPEMENPIGEAVSVFDTLESL